MKMCYKLFFFVIFTVVGTASVLGEPCLDGQGSTNMKACLLCATNGKGKGQCCNDIYYNSNDRDDDFLRGDKPSEGGCIGYGATCDIGSGACNPGLICTHHYTYGGDSITCDYPPGTPGSATTSLLRDSSYSSEFHHDGHQETPKQSLVNIPVMMLVSLLGAAMIALKGVKNVIIIRRDQYSEVDNATTHIHV